MEKITQNTQLTTMFTIDQPWHNTDNRLLIVLLRWQDFETRSVSVAFTAVAVTLSMAMLTRDGSTWSRSYSGELTTTAAGSADCKQRYIDRRCPAELVNG